MSRNRIVLGFILLGPIVMALLFYVLAASPSPTSKVSEPQAWEQVQADPDTIPKGMYHYRSRCPKCHVHDGSGSYKGPSLIDAEWQYSKGDLDGIAKVIRDGTPSGKMRGWRGKLQESDIQAIAVYVYELRHY